MSRRAALSKNKNTKQIRRERDPIPWRYCFLTFICGIILVGGFFFAARTHFSSMDFGIKNSKLKKQKEELEASQRQLLLTKEIALSPAEIKKAAKKLGLTEMTAANVEAFYPNGGEKPKAEKISDAKTVKENPTKEKADAKKTDEKKSEKDLKPEKKPVEAKEKKEKKEVKETKSAK